VQYLPFPVPSGIINTVQWHGGGNGHTKAANQAADEVKSMSSHRCTNKTDIRPVVGANYNGENGDEFWAARNMEPGLLAVCSAQ